MIEKAKKSEAAPAASKGYKQPVSHGVGRRKSSVARVWLRRGNGAVVINGKKHTEYFDTELTRQDAITACRVVPSASRYDVEVNVMGGGLVSQAGAVRLGIARAIVSVEEEARILLRKHGLLTVDSRLKERKKYGRKAARRGFQFVKR
jgi:small subunit ribosomal protein S9